MGRFNFGDCGKLVGLGLLLRGHDLIDLVLADGARRLEPAGPLEPCPREFEPGLYLLPLGLGLADLGGGGVEHRLRLFLGGACPGERRLVGPRVDHEEQLPLLDRLAFLEVVRHEIAVDAGPHLDLLDRRQPAGIGIPVDRLDRQRRGHGHLWRAGLPAARGGIGRGATANAGCQHRDRHRGRHEHGGGAMRSPEKKSSHEAATEEGITKAPWRIGRRRPPCKKRRLFLRLLLHAVRRPLSVRRGSHRIWPVRRESQDRRRPNAQAKELTDIELLESGVAVMVAPTEGASPGPKPGRESLRYQDNRVPAVARPRSTAPRTEPAYVLHHVSFAVNGRRRAPHRERVPPPRRRRLPRVCRPPHRHQPCRRGTDAGRSRCTFPCGPHRADRATEHRPARYDAATGSPVGGGGSRGT